MVISKDGINIWTVTTITFNIGPAVVSSLCNDVQLFPGISPNIADDRPTVGQKGKTERVSKTVGPNGFDSSGCGIKWVVGRDRTVFINSMDFAVQISKIL